MPIRAPGAAAVALTDRAIDGRTHVVALQGQVDLYSAPELRRRIDGLIDAGKTLQAIDLTEACFVDSTTIGVLVGAIMRLRLHDGRLAVACAEPEILRVLEITGLDQVVCVRARIDEALATLRDSA